MLRRMCLCLCLVVVGRCLRRGLVCLVHRFTLHVLERFLLHGMTPGRTLMKYPEIRQKDGQDYLVKEGRTKT